MFSFLVCSDNHSSQYGSVATSALVHDVGTPGARDDVAAGQKHDLRSPLVARDARSCISRMLPHEIVSPLSNEFHLKQNED